MVTTFRLNTSELGNTFINSLKEAYPDQNVEIMVRVDDDTEYLCSSPANREHLEKSIENVERGQNIRYFETLEDAIAYAQSNN